MSFWTSQNFHPKTKSKFVVNLGGNVFYTVKSITKPKLTIENHEFRMINHFYKFPGLAKWEPIDITFVDGYGEHQSSGSGHDGGSLNNTAAFLAAMANKIGYVGNDHKSFDERSADFDSRFTVSNIDSITKEASKKAFATNNGDPIIFIEQVNSNGLVIEKWKLYNPTIKSLEWGDLQYGSDDIIEYKMSLEYDYAKFESPKDLKAHSSGRTGNIYNT
jgi:hypothetical protein